MDIELDERLVKHGLMPAVVNGKQEDEPPLHIRRTLDQAYFMTLKDTSRRDRDQVVYRATKKPWFKPGHVIRVVMVDQLWLWILDEREFIHDQRDLFKY